MREIFSVDSYQKPSRPFIPPGARTREFTLRAVLWGLFLGLIFGLSNAYFGLKLGATTSVSIASAAISIGFSRLFFKKVSILENNISQTIASVGEGVAAGAIFTVPAMILYGATLNYFNILILVVFGAILGVLYMVFLRRPIIVDEFGKLPFPEGFACAEILKSSESKDRPKGRFMFLGFLVGGLYKICISGFNLWKEIPSWNLFFAPYFTASINCTPAILAMGFIVGTKRAFLIFVGGGISWWVLTPLIHLFAQGNTIISPGEIPIPQMSSEEIWFNYTKYIGGGALAMSALVNMWKPAKNLIKECSRHLKEFSKDILGYFNGTFATKSVLRTEEDLSNKWVILGTVLMVSFLWLFPPLLLNFWTVFFLTLLGLFFAALSSYTAGIVGSSSNPTSGMIVTIILISIGTCQVLGLVDRSHILAILSMSVVVCTTISMTQTTAQDLNTGYILGATPRYQQIGGIIGVILPAIASVGCIFLVNHTSEFGSVDMPAPQATMIFLLVKALLEQGSSLALIAIGAILILLFYLIRLSSYSKLDGENKNKADFKKDYSEIALALGLFLPSYLSLPFILGGLVAGVVKHYSKTQDSLIRGDILCSGLFTGDACVGVLILFFTFLGWMPAEVKSLLPNSVSLLTFFLLAFFVVWFSVKPPSKLFSKR